MHRSRSAFTLMEVLVVIAVLVMLITLAMPAIQHARSSARRATCQNQLRQLGVAVLLHESAVGYFPTGGWGGVWVGDADRGFDNRQPGGWVFNVLPFIEEKPLHDAGAGMDASSKAMAIAARLVTPVAVFNCPERRAAGAYPLVRPLTNQPRQSSAVKVAARSDYAMNAGAQHRCECRGILLTRPKSMEEGDAKGFPWPDTSDMSGVSFLRSEIRLGSIERGLSKTYLLGEKSLSQNEYGSGTAHGDDWSMYTGYQDDVYRSTSKASGFQRDITLNESYVMECGFGSAHASGAYMAFCDGAVVLQSFNVEADIHEAHGSRSW